jgi:hypothetical protein
MERRNIITDALIRAFYLSRVESLFPGRGLKILTEAYGPEVGQELYNALDLSDIPGWFSKLKSEHKAIFLEHPAFYKSI